MRDLHVRLDDKAGRQLEEMAKAERRTLGAQVEVLIETEWDLGGYESDDNQKEERDGYQSAR
jgi:hypothetical protein